MKTMHLQSNIEHEDFHKLLEICFRESEHFTLMKYIRKFYEWDEFLSYRKFLSEMQPYYLKTLYRTHWHYNYSPHDSPFVIYVFQAEEEAKKILLQYVDDLSWRRRKRDGTFSTGLALIPDSICFFKEKKLLLGKVSCEEICTAYPASPELQRELMQLGKWTVHDDIHDMEERIILDV